MTSENIKEQGIPHPEFSPRDELTTKQIRVSEIQEKLSSLNSQLHNLSRKFHIEAGKLQQQIQKVQFSRPRGNPANYWPHRPMTTRIQLFYEAKERRESFLRKNKDILKLSFDHSKAIITSEKKILDSELFDLESQMRLLKVRYPALR